MEKDRDPRLKRTELLTEKELSVHLSLARETLSRWRHHRGMPFMALGDGPRPRIRYDLAAVEAWLRARPRDDQQESAPRRRGRPTNLERAARLREGGSR